MGSEKLANRLEIEISEAKKFISEYFKLMRQTKIWIDTRRKLAEQEGIASSKMGRYRHYKKKKDLKEGELEEYNSAVNHPIQSLASDLVLYGMSQWKKYLLKQNIYNTYAWMVLQVHDSILSSILDKIADKLILTKKKVFEATKFPFMILPLTTEIKTGYNWGEMKKLNI
jgi:DNA polymerase I-like protein with 3'-5' exonuclease and polymerase domains